MRISNGGNARRVLDVTSYTEVVLAAAATDAAHPAFNKLFVETEILPEHRAVLCTHRARAPDDPAPWMFHLLAMHEPFGSELTFETDRMRFVGRGHSTADPQALDADAGLTGSAGPVLDPVAAIRCQVTLDPGASTFVDQISGIAETRDGCMALIHKYRDRQAADQVLTAAPANGGAILERLHVSEIRVWGAVEWPMHLRRFCRKVWFFEQNRKTGHHKFNDLQDSKFIKNKLCDRTPAAIRKEQDHANVLYYPSSYGIRA